jgi:protein-tyrosine phosphatase
VDYHQIIPGLFVGSHPASARDIETLRSDGVSAVLNLQTDEDMRQFNLEWASLLAHYEARSIELRRVPVRDFDADDLKKQLPACVAALDDLVRSAHTVYLHCSAGAGRSPTVAVAYLCWLCGWDLDAAAAHVLQCRPCTPNLEAIRLARRR